jgi:acetyltransferase-like isoleucine patch superfamily enzyme
MTLWFVLKNYRHYLRRLRHRGAGGAVSIGPHTYGTPRLRWWGEPANLTIGKFCSIAEGVEIFLGGNHRTDWVTTYPFPVMRQWPQARAIHGHPATRGDVRIGNDVWLGAGCVVLSGVTIGDGAVIAGRAVVSRDVPPYAIVAGNPATVVRMRFGDAQIRALQAVAWWNWEPGRIRGLLPRLLSNDVDGFLREASPGR